MTPRPADPRRRFTVIQGGGEPDAPTLAERLLAVAARAAARPDLRRTPLDEPVVLRLRIEINGSAPPIWRLVDVRTDISLADLHTVIQAAFGWWDHHLYRFALGGDPFDAGAQLFLCPFDAAEGDEEGIPVAAAYVDEVLQGPGDSLAYVYDYGDHWDLTLRVEEVRPAAPDTPPAVAVGGERAAPPEDCGGMRDAASLAELLADPAAVDLDAVNAALTDPGAARRAEPAPAPAIPATLARVLAPLAGCAAVDDLVSGLEWVPADEPPPPAPDLAAAFHAVQWFLDRCSGDGLPLTQAGYLKPDDTLAAAAVVPGMVGWIGMANREANADPLRRFRRSLLTVGLLRKYRGRLMLTTAGDRARRDPVALWDHLADTVTRPRAEFAADAAPLLVAGVAAWGTVEIERVAEILTRRGWRTEALDHVHPWAVRDVGAVDLLENLRPRDDTSSRHSLDRPLGDVAVALAREAVRRLG